MKRYISLIMILMIILVSITSYAEGNFITDTATHWAKEFIARMVESGIISGYPDGTFRPNANIKVSEFTTLVLKTADINIEKVDGIWYQGAINTAKKYGIIEEGEFADYNRNINRGEMTRMIVRTLDKNPSTGRTSFDDDSSIPSNIKGYVKKTVELGIIGGYPDNTFRHSGNATRAEATVVLTKMEDILEENPVELEPIVDIPVEPTEPPILSSPPERLYNEPISPATYFTKETDLAKAREELYEKGMLSKRLDNIFATQSEDFAELYFGFDYTKKQEYENKLKYYYAGSYSDKQIGITNLTKDVDFVSAMVDYMADSKVKGEARFYTSEDLNYVNSKADYSTKGTLHFIYYSNENLPDGVELNKWYEQDMEILWRKPLLSPELGQHNHAEYTASTLKIISEPRVIK